MARALSEHAQKLSEAHTLAAEREALFAEGRALLRHLGFPFRGTEQQA